MYPRIKAGQRRSLIHFAVVHVRFVSWCPLAGALLELPKFPYWVLFYSGGDVNAFQPKMVVYISAGNDRNDIGRTGHLQKKRFKVTTA